MKHTLYNIIMWACGMAVTVALSQPAAAQGNVYVNGRNSKANVECVPFVTGVSFEDNTMTLTGAVSKTYSVDTLSRVSLADAGLPFAQVLPASIMEKYYFEIPWVKDLASTTTTAEERVTDSEADGYNDFVENSVFTKLIKIHFDAATQTARCDGSADGVTVEIEGAQVTVHSAASEVEYELSGASQNGGFKLYSEHKAKITLCGLNLQSRTGAPLNIQSKKRMFIVLAEGTENALADSETYNTPDDEDEKGCLFSEGQLCFSGKGTLRVTGLYKHGIVSDQYIRVSDGKLQVETVAQKGAAIKAKECFSMGGGYVQLLAKGDAAKALASDSIITMTGGRLYAFTTGGVIYSEKKDDYTSCSCIKSELDMHIAGGEIGVMATGVGGKGINCGKNLTLGQSGSDAAQPIVRVKTLGKRIPEIKEENDFTGPAASPKGIKAAGSMTVNGGDFVVETIGGDGGEGFESKGITTIYGGNLCGFCVDDILNANGGLHFYDGSLTGASLTNDGLDVIWLYCHGGYSYIVGGSGEQAAFDTDGKTFYYNGGTHLGVAGSESGLPDYRSQGYSVNARVKGNFTHVSVRDMSGEDVVKMEVPSQYEKNKRGYNYGVMICSPQIQGNTAYTLCGINAQGEATKLYEFTTNSKNIYLK